MSSTEDELSDGESQPQSSAGDEVQETTGLGVDAQTTNSLASSPPIPTEAVGEQAQDAETDGSQSDDWERENLFHGPASTWRTYTKDERELVASLDRQRANDLSIHLYNAHTLKSRLYNDAAISSAKPWNGKHHWMEREEDGNLPWQPDRNWTAWPLPANEVPRKEEVFGAPIEEEGEHVYRKSRPWLPSADLQEELQALMLNKAKERFRQRRWVTSELPFAPHSNVAAVVDDHDTDLDTESSSSESSSDSSGVVTKSGVEKTTGLPEKTYVEPAFLADDDKAKAILQPGVRHIISRLESLLLGLHKSRQGHRRPRSNARSQSQASASRSRSRPDVTTNATKSALPSKARPEQRSRGKQKATSGAMESEDSASENEEDLSRGRASKDAISAHAEHQRSKPSGPNNHELGLRDWSEVLGMATLTGWDQAVVDRAARRCASLFGEGMSFRTMPETTAGKLDDHNALYVPEKVPLDLSGDGSDEVVTGAVMLPSWLCPYDSCPRHHDAYGLAWRWREHLRRTHKLSWEQVAEIEGKLRQSDEDRQDIDVDTHAEYDGEAEVGVEHAENELRVGGVLVDGFLQHVTENLGRGKDAKQRQKSSSNGRKGSKRRKLKEDEVVETVA